MVFVLVEIIGDFAFYLVRGFIERITAKLLDGQEERILNG